MEEENISNSFVTFSVHHYDNGVPFLLNSQWKWDVKKLVYKDGKAWYAPYYQYHLIADVDGDSSLLIGKDIWVDDDIVVEETKQRPKVIIELYEQRRGDQFIEGMEDYKHPHERKRDFGQTMEDGYLKINEGQIPFMSPSRAKKNII